MKNKILLLFFTPWLSFAQIGMNTTDPRTMLDVNGAVTHREVSFTAASNAVNINIDTSLASITGSATGIVAITAFTPTIDGHILTISNNTTGGFSATFSGTTILNGQAVAFVYTNSAWKTTLGSSTTATDIYNSNGTLTGNRTVTMGSNNLTFSGSGRPEFQAPAGLGFAKDTRMGIAAIYFIAIGDAYGMEKVSAAQTGTTDALRVFTSNFAGAPHLAFGKFTNTTAFTTFARFTSAGSFGVAISPTSTFDVNGSIANSITVISANLTLDQNHKTVIIPLGSAFTVTLPAAASGVTGRIYSIINNSASSKSLTVNYINLAGSSVSTINASSCVEVQSDGINWYQIR
ncbi:hypothetical protein SAMN05444671_3936 [Flavobacterium sp. CF108]|uniref:hypothetical protein n=1 Tax=unclassified Flavobacterium TaxID=196869 RepID=UPI0008B9D4DD|nr:MULTISPECIES: hypothetical protein [unclassified Flavobacterium]SEO94419.1 hypothetical protein SAMN04487978_4035 [Flavobacterium sp. fv08]SHH82748.1 hypothetical protein SAMN05444671_3936 [Flavobacterium sp. CF108]